MSINEAIEKFYKENGDLAGIDFLRHAINYLDSRDESLNKSKSPVQLLGEYAKRRESLYYNS